MRFHFLTALFLGLSSGTWAASDFLPPDQAFKFEASSISKDTAELKWDIVPKYYLYHDQFKVIANGKNIHLNLPKGQQKDDPTFGLTDVHYNNVTAEFKVQPNQQYQIQWQGCADDGLCYPVQRMTIQTDDTGLLPQTKPVSSQTNLALLAQTPQKTTPDSVLRDEPAKTAPIAPKAVPALTDAENVQQKAELSDADQIENVIENDSNNSVVSAVQSSSLDQSISEQNFKQDWNNDQFFLHLLSSQTVWINIIVFLGLGILLAFLPCSLPLIPILSGILVQQKKGHRAALIAITFVVSMALVYALMGLVVAQLGFNIQRWFQNPVFISLFVLMFIVFALNLFGLYQLSLPQALLQRLDRLQQSQKGGTFIGAGVMGAVSALIVGPCMSAPLAGALLYVSQLEHGWLGGLYLFLMGLGIGIPLFIASVFGAKYLPKPGLWMERLKFSFGFVMLAMAIYFARPLLGNAIYHSAFAIVLFVAAGYLITILRHIMKLTHRLLILAVIGVVAATGTWHAHLALSSLSQQQVSSLHQWIVVRNQQELQQALSAHPDQPVLIDVYADWCVACQPIERQVIPSVEVQAAIANVVRIKLDLTHYEASQNLILKQRQILGPPTVLFLNEQHEEQRNLRLTGTFTAHQLVQNVKQLSGVQP
ncbi:protein-disulfide reductase DsbD [Acinetobacter gyllenbergii]|uniref:protein-disulfide reductase DsbD n=1 Tax=Acinetobacter gyllenbergii TaxID=134534 RepID=UPI0021D1DCDD|nr:protein-disulfide reductase DsbD [Acinetobacter gyllenbergii]MCU4579996.1 protein-disulfide reductase DsbD [Acinetobacter gyllenbergii]